MSKESELGTLVVVILKARNLIDKHSFYKQDVFAQAYLNGISKKTQVDVKGGQHPVWDAELRFAIMGTVSDKTRKLEISCFAKEPRSDDLLGKGSLDIAETLKTGEFDDWVSLDIDGVVRGEVYLEMTYFSSSPVPVSKPSATSLAVPLGQSLARRPSKLPKSERLYRPPQTFPAQPMLMNVTDRPPSSAFSAQSLRAHTDSSPPRSKGSALPPLPEDQSGQAALPGILMPGGASRPNPQVPPPSSGPLPSILRPRNGNASLPTTRPLDRARLSASPSSDPVPLRQSSPSLGTPLYTNSSSTPNPYLTGPPSTPTLSSAIPPQNLPTTPMVNYPHYTGSFAPPSFDTNQAPYESTWSTTPSFPVPVVLTTPQPDLPRQLYTHYQSTYDETPPSQPDPYLQARYRNPLPLPPRNEPQPTPSFFDSQRTEHQINSDRLGALERAEEEATRRREQELKDLELALRLDRELNT